MSDRLDKELSRHIQAVFDAYDEPYDAGNWQRLQRKRRGRVIGLYLRWAGTAASVAILLAAGILLWNREPVGTDPFLTRTGDTESRLDIPDSAPASHDPTADTGESPENLALQNQENSTLESGTEPGTDRNSLTGETDLSQEQVVSSPAEPVLASEENTGLVAAGQEIHAADAANAEAAADASVIAAEVAAANANDDIAAANDPAAAASNTSAGKPDAFPSPSRQQEVIIAGVDENHNQGSAYGEESGSNAPEGRFSIGFVTTSLMNYASGNTASEVHFGAGITSGWKLSDRLSVHSGLILAENSLSLNSSNSSVQTSTYAMDRAATTELSAVGENSIVQKVSPNSMDVNLLIVDIPLNVTYRVEVGNSSLLVTGGLSSFAYLDQEYSYHNTMQLYTNASVDAPEPVVRNEKAFSHFDLARQLNLAVGTEVALGKGSVLIVEPYVKYPLGELTSEDIRFGSAGMNLRLSFGSNPK